MRVGAEARARRCSLGAVNAAHALLLEAKVLTRDGVVPAALADRLQARLERVEGPLDGSMVMTLALLDAARGELERARQLFESVSWLPASAVGDELAQWARGWLLSDAAAAGDWPRVEALATPASLEGRFFSALARRLRGQLAQLEPDDRLRLPGEAVRFFELGGRTARETEDEAPGTLASLLAALVGLRPPAVVRVARTAVTVLAAPWLRAHLFERATLLGGGSPDEALDELRELVRERLGCALDGAAGDTPLLREAAADRREALLQSLEERLDALTRRCETDRAPPLPVLWGDFVRAVHDTRLAARLSEPQARAVPHQVAVRRLRYLGAWLRVTKDQQAFARAVFGQLEALAREAGDEVSAGLAATAATWCRT